MERICSLLSKKFNDKFSYLKPLEVVYNTNENVCTISFLYPENISTLTNKEKEEIANYLAQTLNLSATIVVKFHKSFLEDEIIISAVMKFFSKFQRSLASVMKAENISIKKDAFDIELTITLPEKILQSVETENIKINLIAELNKEFIANFSCVFQAGENINEQIVKEKIDKLLEEKIGVKESTPRYKVFEPATIVGKDITPQPEYMANIKGNKESVILAGKVENLVKKSYKRKRKDEEIEKFYIKFTLREDNRYINMIYFCPKSNVKKMDKICDGDSVLVIADIKKENGFLSGYIRSLSLCEINEDVRRLSKEKITTYQVVCPQKYTKLTQSNIFESAPKFNENITQNTFVVYDVETTGLDPETCEIIEIGAVKICGGQIIEKFQTLVKPTGEITPLITEITGINEELVKNSPPIEKVIKDFFLFSKDCVLSGYNVNFDMKFIQKAGRENGIKFENEVQDVMSLARQKVKCGNYKLSSIVKALNLTLDNAHRAFFDALATAEILLQLSKQD